MKVIGADHAGVAGMLLDMWELPDMLQEAVAYHHTPNQAEHYPTAASIVEQVDRQASEAVEMFL